MLFYSDARARNSFSKSITYTGGNKTENIGCRYGSSRSGSGSKRAATHVPSSAAEPRRSRCPWQTARAPGSEILTGPNVCVNII